MKVRFTPRAFSDREAIYQYRVTCSPSGARNVMARLTATIALLAEQSAIGYQTENPQVRVKFVGDCPYKIFYRVRAEDL